MKHTKGQSMPDGTIQYYKDAMGRAMVSTDYDPTSSYAVGDYCIYDNVRYCCNTAIASGGETWNSAHWDVAKVDDDVTEIKQSLSQLHLKAYTVTKIEGTLTATETTYNNIQVGGEYRKFSDYDYLLFLLKYSNSDIRDTVLMPTAYWASGSQVARQILHGVGGTTAANYNVSGIISKYNADTSIKANTTGNNTFKYLEIIGLKIQAN